MRSSLLRVAFAAVVAGSAAIGAGAGPARAASIAFGTPTASSTFGKGIDFTQPYTGAAGIAEVDIVIQYEGAFGISVAKVENPGSTTFEYSVDTSSGEVEPNTRLVAHFEVTFSDGSVQDGPDISVTYMDDRFTWRTKTGTLVTIHWYQGSDAFAQQALNIGEDGIAKAAEFLGYAETEPIDFYVYADQQPFYDALGPGTRDNVGGQANTQTRTLFALVAPDELAYAASVVPHELTHVVFDDVTGNPYHYPPHWLNEGIAVYLSQGYDSSDRGRVEAAASSGTLMPLAAIRGQFPTTQTQFYLAYAESVSAVDYFIRTYGHDDLAKLVQAFGEGVSDDEAFAAAIGMGVDAFDKGWQAAEGVAATPSFGPQPAPTGPIPPGWTASGLSGPSQPPGASPAVAPAHVTAGPTPAPSAPGPAGGSTQDVPTLLIAAGLLGFGGVMLLVIRARPQASP